MKWAARGAASGQAPDAGRTDARRRRARSRLHQHRVGHLAGGGERGARH